MNRITFNVDPTLSKRRLSDFFIPAVSTDEEIRSHNRSPPRDYQNQIVAEGNLIQQTANDNNTTRDNHDRYINNPINSNRHNSQLETHQQFFNNEDSDWDLDTPTVESLVITHLASTPINNTCQLDKPDNKGSIISKDYAGTKYPFDEFDNTVPILTTGYPPNFYHSSGRPTKLPRLESSSSSSTSHTHSTVIKPKRPPLVKPQSVPKAAPPVSATKGRGYYSGLLPKR